MTPTERTHIAAAHERAQAVIAEERRGVPAYEFAHGETRPARTIAELPHQDRAEALERAGAAICDAFGVPRTELFFGWQIWRSLGMKRDEVKGHAQRAFLETLGCDIGLGFAGYEVRS